MIACLGTTPTVQRTMVFSSVHLDAVNRAQRVIETASGKSVNVARVARTLGVSAIAIGFAGGQSGELIRDELSAIGVEHRFIRVTAPTRTCVTVIDESRGVSTELVEESSEVEADAYEQLLSVLRDVLPGRRALVLSGSLTPKAAQDFYARCVQLANAAGVMTLVDARGEPLSLSLPHQPAVVKPNVSELAATMGRALSTESEVLEAARELLGRGAQRVIVTRGTDPLLAVESNNSYRVHGPGFRGKYPIGSGDSFAAGVAVAMARGESFCTALCLGAACGTANAMVPVAGSLRSSDVQQALSRVRAETI